MQHIELRSYFEDIYRKGFYEIPHKAIRELIAHAVCHRSSLVPEKIQVAIYDDRLEITSSGMLYDVLIIAKMIRARSKPRNRVIANAFVYMEIIESWEVAFHVFLNWQKNTIFLKLFYSRWTSLSESIFSVTKDQRTVPLLTEQ